MRQRRHGIHVGLRAGGLHPELRRLDFRAHVPGHQNEQLAVHAEPVELQQPAPDIDGGVQMHIHRIAGERAHEQTGRADRQRLTGAFHGQTVNQRLRHHFRDVVEVDAVADGLAQLADGGVFVIAGALAQDAAEQAMFLDQPIIISGYDRVVGKRVT